jgi:hypothetical protein
MVVPPENTENSGAIALPALFRLDDVPAVVRGI